MDANFFPNYFARLSRDCRATVARPSRDVRANVANLSPRNFGEFTMRNFRDTRTNVVRVSHDGRATVLRQHAKNSRLYIYVYIYIYIYTYIYIKITGSLKSVFVDPPPLSMWVIALRSYMDNQFHPDQTVAVQKMKISIRIIFIFFASNIDCGYTLEPPHQGGSY